MPRAKAKFQSPPTFGGRPHEDPLAWTSRYEDIGHYNGWTDEDLNRNLSIYLDGPARHWYLCKREDMPRRWLTRLAGIDADRNPVPQEEGTRDLFLKEFMKGNYKLFIEQKLRSRTQGADECPIAYFYDILNMCRILDHAMPETTKLDHLYRGLQKALFIDIYVKKPATSSDFLVLLKLHADARDMAKHKELCVAVVRPGQGSEETDRMSSYIHGQSPGQETLKGGVSVVESLLHEIRKLKTEIARMREQMNPQEDEDTNEK